MKNTTTRQPVLTVQVDVDTTRDLLAFYGLPTEGGSLDDAAYALALPRFAELFDSLGIRATFFVIGRDLADEDNRRIVRQLHRAGHEIANHTQTHDFGFGRLDRQQKRGEVEKAERAITSAIGERPVGFRAPGYDADADLLEILVDLGYAYDSSILPSVLNLPFKLLSPVLGRRRSLSGYGEAALSLAPNRPYRPDPRTIWRGAEDGVLWEIPLTCVPYARVPFYANFSLLTGDALFRLSSALTDGRHCNYVFHAVEMLDPSEIDPRLHRHPNARTSLTGKMARCRRFLERLAMDRRVLPSRDFAASLGRLTAIHGRGSNL